MNNKSWTPLHALA
ncbi:hypothetical protein ABFA07_005718 [Porites harrisoni]